MMTARTLSIADLMDELKKDNSENTARAISKAFEQVIEQQHVIKQEIKHEVLEEVRSQDLATKGDLLAVKSEIKAEIHEIRSDIKAMNKMLAWNTRLIFIMLIAVLGAALTILFHH